MTKVNLISFGYKHRRPPEATRVFDCRGWPNPYRVPFLREKDGRSDEVQDYVRPHANIMLRVSEVMYEAQKAPPGDEVTFAYGCMGGHHRSVAAVEMIAAGLRGLDMDVSVEHREL